MDTQHDPQIDPAQVEERINMPAKGWQFIDVKELWAYRRLLVLLSWRDIRVRYKQTLLGISWAILNPLVLMVVFTFVFNRLASIETYGIPYPIFTFSGLVIWNLFSKGVITTSQSVVQDGALMSKVYYPRMISPLAKLGSAFIDFSLALIILLLMILFWGIVIPMRVILLPLFVVLALITAAGIGLWFAALYVRYRDVNQLVPFMIQIWLYLSPVAYPTDLIESSMIRTLYGLNPMVGVVDGFRWTLVGDYSIYVPTLGLSVVVAFLLFASGVLVFRRMERTFVDYI